MDTTPQDQAGAIDTSDNSSAPGIDAGWGPRRDKDGKIVDPARFDKAIYGEPPPPDNSGAAPVEPRTDMGPAPYAQEMAQDTVGEGMSKLGNKIGDDLGEGWQNLKNSGVGKAVQRVGGLLSGGEQGNPAAAHQQAPPAGAQNPQVVSLLMGASAAHPDALEQTAQQVDPGGKLPAGDRNLLAIDHIRDTQGDAAAEKLLQANRVAYNGQQAFAKTALTGTPQKPADIGAAIDAANKAQANVLDGSNVSFAHHGDGITATVSMHGAQEPQVIQLSPQAFGAWLDVGGDGQWDKIMQQSAPATLQKLSQQYPAAQAAAPAAPGAPAAASPQAGMATVGKPAQPRQQSAPAQAAPDDDADEAASPTPAPAAQRSAPVKRPTARDVTQGDQPALPGTHDANGHYIGSSKPERSTNYGEEAEARADAMFGKYPNTATAQARQEWLAQQDAQSEGLQNKIDVAAETGKNRRETARITAGGKTDAEIIRAQGGVDKAKVYTEGKQAIASSNRDAAAGKQQSISDRQAIESARKDLDTKRATGAKLTPEEEDFAKQLTQTAMRPGQRPAAPRQQAAPASADTGQVPAPDQRVVNKVYNTPKGPHRWMGDGWQAVQ